MPDSTALKHDITASDVEVDTVAADTAVAKVKYVNFLELKKCHEVDAPKVQHLKNVHLGRVAYVSGVEPETLTPLPGYDSGVMCMMVVIFLIITANCRHYSTFLKSFATDLFSVRQRANAFNDNHTVSETRMLVSLIILTCVCEGILLFSAIVSRGGGIESGAFQAVGLLSLLSGAYYAWQLLAYRTVGYIFAKDYSTSQWLRGFNASQSLLGLGLVVPAMVTLFNPGLSPLLLSISVFLYATARLIFISKGFRIFYDNYSSLVYFILYLCTLEIIPPIILYRIALNLTVTY